MKTILLQGQGGFDPGMLLMMAAIFGVIYFFMIRPQKKKEKEFAKKRESALKGDTVITTGGVHGVIFNVDDTTAVITVENQARIRIEKSSIAVLNGEGAAQPAKK
jgi:preprotein translocase subunit YajC